MSAINHRYFIYFLEAPGVEKEPIKVGIAINPQKRCKGIQASSPVPLILLGYIGGDSGVEADLHHRWRYHRLHGEWFSSEIKPDVLEMLYPRRWKRPGR